MSEEDIQVIKYRTYEVIETNNEKSKMRILGIMKDKQFNNKYGHRQILSIKNYDDTRTTSIIILNENL